MIFWLLLKESWCFCLSICTKDLETASHLSSMQEQFTFFSNYGVESVELVAPGQNILSLSAAPLIQGLFSWKKA